MTYSDNMNVLWQWQLFALMYAVALLAGLPLVADWPGIAVGILELIGVFVTYLAICAAVTGILFGVIYICVLAHKRPRAGFTRSKNSPH